MGVGFKAMGTLRVFRSRVLLLGVGFRLVDTSAGEKTDYFRDFTESTFCVAATGHGWAARDKLALYHGCIPIVIADDTQVDFAKILSRIAN